MDISQLQKTDLHPPKRMLSIWRDVKGVIYCELLPEKDTINVIKYHAITWNKLEAEVIKKVLIYIMPNHMQQILSKQKIAKFGWELTLQHRLLTT